MMGLGAFLGGISGLASLASWPALGTALAFLASPLGRLVGIGAVVLAAYGIGWVRGDAHADAKCEAAALRAELESVRVDRDAFKAAAESARATVGLLSRNAIEGEEAIRALQLQIDHGEKLRAAGKPDPDARVDAGCRWTPSGVRAVTGAKPR